ncbi:glutamate-cysteine ligase family protein [Peptococcaceae bacterium 1198_IL3148]
MDYEKQIAVIEHYLRKGEKDSGRLLIGVEMEHLILHKETLTAVSYYEENGVEAILQSLLNKGWQGLYEDGYLLGLERAGSNITLEPGGQLEISIKPLSSIDEIETEYLDFLQQIIPILEANKQLIMAIGYQPVSKIADIPFIPKKRYTYMSDYLQHQGKYALNMMKGTAAMHVNVDYRSELDYIKKSHVANCLGPTMAVIFDNSPVFEGDVTDIQAVRTIVWQNCDNDRCGIVPASLSDDFGYRKYAQYILDTPPILVKRDTIMYTKSIKNKELFNPDNYTQEELEYMLTMVFPDIRTKGHLEIRVSDSVPYPYNIAGIALWKGLLYNDKNLDELYHYFAEVNEEDIQRAKNQVVQQGYQANFKDQKIYELAQYIINLAKTGLTEHEQAYLQPLVALVQQRESLASISKAKLKEGDIQALERCVLNNLLAGEFNGFQHAIKGICCAGN